jgi:hypothetical protein
LRTFAGRPRAQGRRLRLLAFLVELDELIFAGRHFRQRRLAIQGCISNAFGVQRDGAHGVVVPVRRSPSSGAQLVSTVATTGMPSFFASWIAIFS